MKRCGLDPSFNGFTVSVFENDELIDFLFIATRPKIGTMNRILLIGHLLEKFIKKHKIKTANVEQPFFNKRNVKTYGIQQRLHQHVLYVLFKSNVDYGEFTSTEVRKVIGKGIVTKDDLFEKFKADLKINKSIRYKELTEAEREGLLDSIAVGMV